MLYLVYKKSKFLSNLITLTRTFKKNVILSRSKWLEDNMTGKLKNKYHLEKQIY